MEIDSGIFKVQFSEFCNLIRNTSFQFFDLFDPRDVGNLPLEAGLPLAFGLGEGHQ